CTRDAFGSGFDYW
nr:immunoglobulin heavy chain junction region [Macaca mulatta]